MKAEKLKFITIKYPFFLSSLLIRLQGCSALHIIFRHEEHEGYTKDTQNGHRQTPIASGPSKNNDLTTYPAIPTIAPDSFPIR